MIICLKILHSDIPWLFFSCMCNTQILVNSTEAQRYHCKCNFATASFILLPRDLFYCREFYFTAASFVLLPRDLFYCREFYFITASFILLPRVLLYRREIYFAAASFIFTTGSFIFTTCSKIKLAVVKINSRRQNKTRGAIIKIAAVK